MQVGASLMPNELEAITLLVQRVTKLETLAERAAEDRKEVKVAIDDLREEVASVTGSVRDAVAQITGGRKTLHALWVTGGVLATVLAWSNGWLKWFLAGAK